MGAEDPIAAKLLEDLKGGPYSCTSLVRLSGGSANFTYRGTLVAPLPDKTRTIIIKHAEPYVATYRSWKFDVIRSHYEQTMLTALKSLDSVVHLNIHVTTPHLFEYASITATQILSDYPNSLELKKYFTTHTVPFDQVFRLGVALGLWLKSFHFWASKDTQKPLKEVMKNNEEMVQLKFLVNYGRLLPTIEMFPKILEESRETFEDVEDMMRKEMETGKGDLIHGDFWSGNFLLQDGPIPPEMDPLKILVIDWELSQIGSKAFDLGQCFAELYLLTHFRSIKAGTQLISAFMAGYGPVDEELAFRIALHFGTHLIVWPCRVPGWGQGEVMEECVEKGRDYVQHAYTKDIEFFRGGILDKVFFPGIVMAMKAKGSDDAPGSVDWKTSTVNHPGFI